MNRQVEHLAGALTGRYRIERELGSGGMATVLLAGDVKHNRRVAIKVIRPELYRASGGARFLREIATAARLAHPHILPLHDSGEAAGVLYYVMPYVEGESLRDRLERERQLPVEDVLRIIDELAGALDYAHGEGVIHRDIKPENVLLQAGHALIADFGVARALGVAGAETLTETGFAIGTPMYMSPEQAAASGDLDGRSDQYSLACMGWEMLAGHPPFTGGSPQEVLARHTLDPVPSLRAARPGLPPAIEGAIGKAMAKSPADRFLTAGALARAMRLERAPRRPAPAVRALAAGAAVLMLIVAGWWLLQNRLPAATPGQPAVVSPLLTGEALESHPAWSPTGTLIAYVSDEAGNYDIWIADHAGANRINLTADHAGSDGWPAWSPDGTRLAFLSEREGTGIYVMSTLGGAARRVAPVRAGAFYTFSLQWMADGSLVFMDFDSAGAKQIWRLDSPEAERAACLTCALRFAGSGGALSADGTRLAFATGLGNGGSLHVSELRTGLIHQVVSLGGSPQWRGDTLLYLSDRDGLPDLWAATIGADGRVSGEPRRLTSALNATQFAVGPAGAVLVTRSAQTSSIWTFPAARRRVGSPGEGREYALAEGFESRRPRWDRGNRTILFESNRRGTFDIWRLSPSSGAVERVTSAATREVRPRPSPDGRWIAYDETEPGMLLLHLMRADGSGSRPLFPRERPLRSGTAAWSPDGRRLAFMYDANDSFMIGLGTLDSSGALRDIDVHDLPGGSEEYPRWSPDGRFIAFESFTGQSWDLWVADATLRNARRLTNSPINERGSAWSPDGRFLYYVTWTGISSGSAIWRLPLDRDARPAGPAELWFQPPIRHGIGVDGIDLLDSLLVTAIVREASDIWLVEWPGRSRN